MSDDVNTFALSRLVMPRIPALGVVLDLWTISSNYLTVLDLWTISNNYLTAQYALFTVFDKLDNYYHSFLTNNNI